MLQCEGIHWITVFSVELLLVEREDGESKDDSFLVLGVWAHLEHRQHIRKDDHLSVYGLHVVHAAVRIEKMIGSFFER